MNMRNADIASSHKHLGTSTSIFYFLSEVESRQGDAMSTNLLGTRFTEEKACGVCTRTKSAVPYVLLRARYTGRSGGLVGIHIRNPSTRNLLFSSQFTKLCSLVYLCYF